MVFKAVRTADLGADEIERTILTANGLVMENAFCRTEEELINACKDADAILLGPYEMMTRRVIGFLDKCRIISHYGIGYDNVDCDSATEKGIIVTNVPDYCLEEVSDHAMALILASSRRLLPLYGAVKAGNWKAGGFRITEARSGILPLYALTIGLAGLGRIAQSLVPKVRGFGSEIIAWDPYVADEVFLKLQVQRVDFEELLTKSDYLSIHVPLTPQTHHLFDLKEFKKMKNTAFIINTSRGPVINEKDLEIALRDSELAGAALDVFEEEPIGHDHPLLKMDNVLLTPHSAFFSVRSINEMRERVATAIVRVFTGFYPDNIVNPKVREVVGGQLRRDIPLEQGQDTW
ncbi:MAG: C-terminal binding protein [Candidatus Tectomicrobia bacterium]|uniref:C-terminal binding protein n=1 Tax=Tectimicrobiota bacterium TaxID=2528274 RepID=A0A933LR28_UNCTE|nr:C-terminal binding protein [Candidatus Tectomicrobia bacterium]